MILVVSNIANEAAPALVNSFPAGVASLVTASDFYKTFRAGISVNDFSSSVLQIQGREISMPEISGVVTTVLGFLPIEFYYISPSDREYVCAETNAFFQYFLNELKCVKCNPPDWTMFIGWNVHKVKWAKAAIKLGIPLAPYHFKNNYAVSKDDVTGQKNLKCTFIFDKVDNSLPYRVQQYTRALASFLAVPYLDCYFTHTGEEDYLLMYINTIPDISISENREIIVKNMLNKTSV